MSRDIDLNKPLTEDEAIYVRQRPWIIQDAQLQGIDIQWPGEDYKLVPPDADVTAVRNDGTTPAAATTPDAVEEPPADADEEVSYEDLKVAQLAEEVKLRNQDRGADEQIVPANWKRDALIAALVADDEQHPEE